MAAVLNMPSASGSTPPRLCLLGRVRTSEGAVEVRPPALRVLAILAVNAGRVVQFHELIKEVYGQNPPDTARVQIGIFISELRRKAQIVSISSFNLGRKGVGYCLDAQEDDIDVLRFKRLVSRAQSEIRAGRHEAAEEILDEGLALSRGCLFEDLEELGDVLAPWAEQVRNLLEAARIRKIKLVMRRGWHEDVLDELRFLWFEDILRADVASLLMLALFRSSRPDEALKVYRRISRSFKAELGIDPPPQLQDMHQGILSGDRSLLEFERDD